MDKALMLKQIMDGKKISSDADFARMIGITPQNLVHWRKRNTYNVTKMATAFPDISREWLLTGEGEMLKDSQKETEAKDPFEISNGEDYEKALSDGMNLIPEHRVSFRGGSRGEAISTDDVVGYWHIPQSKGTDIVTIDGDSMAPVYPSGTKLVLRKIGFNPNHPTGIPFGNPFAVEVEDPDTGGYIGFVKYLRRHKDPELEKKYWIAHSADSDHYDDFDVAIQSVRNLWIVEYAIKKVF